MFLLPFYKTSLYVVKVWVESNWMGGFHSERHLHKQRGGGIETVKELLSFQDLCQIAIESLHCGQSPEESWKFKDWPK